MGLFGSMRTDYQIIISRNDRSLTIEDEDGSYFLTVEY
ncbi:MAG: hypothetical protein UT41_C0009G0003 [Candidatus Wolfebacteria bacterium GW2011_GWC2_39_22]|uniref:Uncharacterized protein n=1 Tax=Candidatus Wolfebacteria bacterium GW2011_GWC2_39_22 TaxID=1619013 RepID=A0A0G0N7Q6_9BACT|nr:MAG: hypothetical protein UT41_C0009G0003 [Candidatus Wolfebacteria bacterium GW2011_GWC2_39_22]